MILSHSLPLSLFFSFQEEEGRKGGEGPYFSCSLSISYGWRPDRKRLLCVKLEKDAVHGPGNRESGCL